MRGDGTLRYTQSCPDCGGAGYTWPHGSICELCSGTGVIAEEEEPIDDNPAEPALNGMWRVGEA